MSMISEDYSRCESMAPATSISFLNLGGFKALGNKV